ncbi:hypothetical protein L7F22_007601 [Adiantum nelumboides]|nr:hypothetical protein [Adiantum nelumboides]
MNVIRASRGDGRLEEMLHVPLEPQKLQRGMFRVPLNLFAQEDLSKGTMTSFEDAPEQVNGKVAKLPKAMSFEDKIDILSSSSSILDSDGTWETQSVSSRYDIYDVMNVREEIAAICEVDEQNTGLEISYVDKGVGQPPSTLGVDDIHDEEADWGFNDPEIEVDKDTQVLADGYGENTSGGPKPRQIGGFQEVKTCPSVDMNVIRASRDDGRLEEMPHVPLEPQKLQRGMLRVPLILFAQEDLSKGTMTSFEGALEQVNGKVAKVPKAVSFKDEVDILSSCSSILDSDGTWETQSVSSRYDVYDVMNVGEEIAAICEVDEQNTGLKISYVDKGVGQPPSTLGVDDIHDEGADWGFNDLEIEVDKDTQVLADGYGENTSGGPKPRQIGGFQEVKTCPSVDMNVIRASRGDGRLEEMPHVPLEPQKLQRGIFRVPLNLFAQEDLSKKTMTSFEDAPEQVNGKVAKVPKAVSFEDEIDILSSSSSILDSDGTWEKQSVSSRYDVYDVMNVGEEIAAMCEVDEQNTGLEISYVDKGVGQPPSTLGVYDIHDEEADWGFNDPEIEVDKDTQVKKQVKSIVEEQVEAMDVNEQVHLEAGKDGDVKEAFDLMVCKRLLMGNADKDLFSTNFMTSTNYFELHSMKTVPIDSHGVIGEVQAYVVYEDHFLLQDKVGEHCEGLEEIPHVPLEPQKLQRGMFRVPLNLFAQEDLSKKTMTSFEDAPEQVNGKVAKVPKAVSFEDEIDILSSSSSILDSDGTWEKQSVSSRYDVYDVMNVGEEIAAMCEVDE